MQISISNAIGGGGGTQGGGTPTPPPFSNVNSFSFDGVDEYFLGTSTYSELDGQNKATISFWIKPQDNGLRILLHVPRNNTNAHGQFLIYQRSGRIQMNIDSSSYYCRTPDNTLILNQWQHVMICMDLPSTDEGKIFINGVDQTSVENWYNRTALSTSIGGLYIGEANNGYLSPFLGNIDEVAIWSGTDLRNDVATIYNNGTPTDLNNNGLTAPTTWQRMGEDATWNGATWTMTDVNGGYTNRSIFMQESSRTTDVPSAPSFSNLNSFSFDGVDEYFTGTSTYSELDGQTKATFSLWIKPTSSSTLIRNVFQIGSGSTGGNGVCQLYLYQGNRIDFSISSASYYGRANISSLNYGSWNHLLIAIDLDITDEFKCYLNGVDVTTSDNLGSRTSFTTATEPLYIGEYTTGAYTPFLGNIDEFAIWSGTDLRNDVATIYNNGTPTDLNNNGLTAPTTWQRMGDNATWNGATWTMTDVNGSYTNRSIFMVEANRSTDVPT